MGGGQERLRIVSELAADPEIAAATTWRLTFGELSILVSSQLLMAENGTLSIGLVV